MNNCGEPCGHCRGIRRPMASARATTRLTPTSRAKGCASACCGPRMGYWSIYSVASVARFDIKHEQIDNTLLTETAPGSPGFFEEHRRQVRWLLYQAVEITKTEQIG